MRILILDTSSDFLYVSMVEDNKEVFKKILWGKYNHSEHLMNIIEEGLSTNHFSMSDFDEIICGIGPGSYTGLRVSLTVSKMLSWTLGKPLYTVSSLDILSSGYFIKDGVYATINIAKKDYVYAKVIEINQGQRNVIFSDQFLKQEEFEHIILQKNYQVVDASNYQMNCFEIIKLKKLVLNVHQVVPNYLRKANS